MIKVDRGDAKPSALDRRYTSQVDPPKLPGKTELQSVIELMKDFRVRESTRGPNDPELKFKFKYERYSHPEVVKELSDLFHGKCAYCESRYAGTQPMDVEHWRPKGEIHVDDGDNIRPGYYWLAAEWTNLLPSCIDCNRHRKQFDVLEQANIVLGKTSQFPLLDDSTRIRRHEDDPSRRCEGEAVALLNPCLDDPEKFLRYDENGVIHPMSQDQQTQECKQAMQSIRVYALNRADLVTERRALIRRIDHRLELIARLAKVRDDLTDKGESEIADTVNDLIADEIDAVLDLQRSEQPYAGLARQLIRDAGGTLRAASR